MRVSDKSAVRAATSCIWGTSKSGPFEEWPHSDGWSAIAVASAVRSRCNTAVQLFDATNDGSGPMPQFMSEIPLGKPCHG